MCYFDLDNNQLFILQLGDLNSNMKIYEDVGGNWSLSATIPSFSLNDKLATNFKVHNDLMFVSLDYHPLLYTAKTPIAVYRKISGNWTFEEYIYGNGPINQDDSFGFQIAISDDTVVISALIEYLPSADGGRLYTTDVTLGLNESNLANSNVYPNPTNGELFLSENMLNDLKTVQVFQIDGKLVSEVQPSQNSVSLNNLQSGLYLLKFIYNNNTYLTKKVIKN